MITNRAGDGCPAEIPGLEIPEDSLTISRHVSTDVTPVRVSSWQMVNNTGQNSWRGLAPTSSVNDRDAHREDVWQILYGMGLVPKSHIVLGRELLESPSKTSFERLVLAGFHPLQDKHLLRIRKFIPQVASVDMRHSTPTVPFRPISDTAPAAPKKFPDYSRNPVRTESEQCPICPGIRTVKSLPSVSTPARG